VSSDYDTGYQNGESSRVADEMTLCDQLGIEPGGRDPLDVFRQLGEAAKRLAATEAYLHMPFGAMPDARTHEEFDEAWHGLRSALGLPTHGDREATS
jgi:hypothetical protein